MRRGQGDAYALGASEVKVDQPIGGPVLFHDQWVAECRPDHADIQRDANSLMRGRESMSCQEFVDTLMTVPGAFVAEYGSDYQKDMLEDHYKQLFWLAVPVEGETAKISAEKFTRVVASLFRPKPPDEKAVLPPNLNPIPAYRFSYTAYNKRYTLLQRDARYARIAIELMFKALREKDCREFFYGAITREEAFKILEEKGLDYIFRLSDSELQGWAPWGINLEVVLRKPVKWYHDPRADKTRFNTLVVNYADGEARFFAGEYTSFPPSLDLNWFRKQVEQKFQKDFVETEKYMKDIVQKEWDKFNNGKSIPLPKELRKAFEFRFLDELIKKLGWTKIFEVFRDTPSVIEAMKYSRIRGAVEKDVISIDQVAQLTSADKLLHDSLAYGVVQGLIGIIGWSEVSRLSKDAPFAIEALRYSGFMCAVENDWVSIYQIVQYLTRDDIEKLKTLFAPDIADSMRDEVVHGFFNTGKSSLATLGLYAIGRTTLLGDQVSGDVADIVCGYLRNS